MKHAPGGTTVIAHRAEPCAAPCEVRPTVRGSGSPQSWGTEVAEGVPTKILIIEDNRADARLMEEILRRVGFGTAEILKAETLAQAIEVLGRVSPDVILLDLTLPDSSGLETVEDVLVYAGTTPVIVQTGLADEALALQAVRIGAQDFVCKADTDGGALARTIHYAVERKRSQHEIACKNQQLRETNANLRQLTFAMTHDLQTPLATLSGATGSLATALGDTSNKGVARWLMRIEDASRRMVDMLDELMLYARFGEQEVVLEPVRVTELLGEVLDSLSCQSPEPRMAFEVDVGDACVLADRAGLRRAFENVVGNAIKYAGGVPGARLTIVSTKSDQWTELRFVDNGCGIDPKCLDKVMLPFKRACANKPGTGLGLAIVRRYLEQMGGCAHAESDGKTGTTIVLRLPGATLGAGSAA